MELIKGIIKRVFNCWDQFWFSKVDLYNLAAFRILYSGVLVALYFSRHFDLQLFYSEVGILPKELALKVLNEEFRPPVLMYFWSDQLLPLVHGFFIFSLLMVCIGFFSRVFTAFAVFLHLGFLFRNYGVAFGVDQITSIFLFFLLFTESDKVWSVKSYILRKQKGMFPITSGGFSDLMTSVGYRFLQIQLCVIYFYSGIEKLKGHSWWDGTALWTVLANPQMVIADFKWIQNFPILIILGTFGTVLFEIYYPVLVWFKKWRKFFLVSGVIFHLGIGVVMALWVFALVMISPYFLFLEEGVLKGKVESILKSTKI